MFFYVKMLDRFHSGPSVRQSVWRPSMKIRHSSVPCRPLTAAIPRRPLGLRPYVSCLVPAGSRKNIDVESPHESVPDNVILSFFIELAHGSWRDASSDGIKKHRILNHNSSSLKKLTTYGLWKDGNQSGAGNAMRKETHVPPIHTALNTEEARIAGEVLYFSSNVRRGVEVNHPHS